MFVGGLKACAWTDLFWGAALIVGGGVVAYFALTELSGADPNHLIQSAAANSGATVASLGNPSDSLWHGVTRFFELNSGDAASGVNTVGGKLHMIRPADDAEIPWTALCLGLWIPNFFYWGLNQYIMQRTLASKSLAEGQMGIVFAAFLKLIIPFVVVVPGILAYNLYRNDLKEQAEVKYAAEIRKTEDPAAVKGRPVIYKLTDSFLVENVEEGCAHAIHNAEVMKVGEDVMANLKQACADLKADAANGGLPAAAGDMGTPEKQAAGDAAVSRFAAGVDCSGFVSRCWRLDRPFSTRELPALCTRLPSWEDLRTGDILIAPGRHVLLFIQWEGTEKSRFLGSEAGPLPAWKCSEHVFSRSMLENSGYRPMRYRGMRD